MLRIPVHEKLGHQPKSLNLEFAKIRREAVAKNVSEEKAGETCNNDVENESKIVSKKDITSEIKYVKE